MGTPKKIIVAVTGASGSIYARLFMERLVACPQVGKIALILSPNGRAVLEHEGQSLPADDPRVEVYDNGDLFAPVASGSARWEAMAVVPCSMGTVGRIASGVSDSLLVRAADVMLKEHHPLVLVPRETPYNTIHLRNMAALSECGAVILPASPSFYSHPCDVEGLCMTVVERLLALLGLDTPHYEWGEKA